MLARVSVLLLVVPYLVAATAVRRGGSTVNQCNTGTLQCCNSVQDASDPTMSGLAGLMGIDLSSPKGQVGRK
ncbi:hypothetical protein F5887DRAFT_1071506 [Amanita rubescens]|nr:hypothetical protein F5887DRAFT_1071506 [Amanita rubescens]